MLVTGFKCDGPRCDRFLHWATDGSAVPDDAHRMIVSRAAYEEPGPNQSPSGQPKERTFCGPKCLRDFYHENSYSEPRSPRELDAIRQANADIERQRNEELIRRATESKNE